MKNIKRTLMGVALVAVVATFFAGCSLSTTQEQYYYSFILGLQDQAKELEISAVDVGKKVVDANLSFKTLGFQVTDKEAGKAIAKGTDGVTLKKRFPTKKA